MGWVLTALMSALVLAAGTAHAGAVVLDDATFETVTQSVTGSTTGDWFILFYSPTCPHCVNMLDTWDYLADQITESHAGVSVAKLNVEANKKDVLTRWRHAGTPINALPTMYYISEGKMTKYEGARDIESLAAFAAAQQIAAGKDGDPVPPLLSAYTRVSLVAIKLADDLYTDTLHILNLRKTGAGVLVGLGVIIGILASRLCGRTPHARPTNPDARKKMS